MSIIMCLYIIMRFIVSSGVLQVVSQRSDDELNYLYTCTSIYMRGVCVRAYLRIVVRSKNEKIYKIRLFPHFSSLFPSSSFYCYFYFFYFNYLLQKWQKEYLRVSLDREEKTPPPPPPLTPMSPVIIIIIIKSLNL